MPPKSPATQAQNKKKTPKALNDLYPRYRSAKPNEFSKMSVVELKAEVAKKVKEGKRVSNTLRAGLQFSPAFVKRKMKKHVAIGRNFSIRWGKTTASNVNVVCLSCCSGFILLLFCFVCVLAAAAYFAAVLEYVCAEILEVTGNLTKELKKKRIIPRHMQLAVHNDEELHLLFKDGIIPEAGVSPHIHSYLIPTGKERKKYSIQDALKIEKKRLKLMPESADGRAAAKHKEGIKGYVAEKIKKAEKAAAKQKDKEKDKTEKKGEEEEKTYKKGGGPAAGDEAGVPAASVEAGGPAASDEAGAAGGPAARDEAGGPAAGTGEIGDGAGGEAGGRAGTGDMGDGASVAEAGGAPAPVSAANPFQMGERMTALFGASGETDSSAGNAEDGNEAEDGTEKKTKSKTKKTTATEATEKKSKPTTKETTAGKKKQTATKPATTEHPLTAGQLALQQQKIDEEAARQRQQQTSAAVDRQQGRAQSVSPVRTREQAEDENQSHA